jgi:DNA repair protein RadD
MNHPLRDYQKESISTLLTATDDPTSRTLFTMATGGGKTRIGVEIARRFAEKGHRSLWVCDRINLIEQTARVFRSHGLRTGILQGANTGLSDDDQVVVASIQTLSTRGEYPFVPSLIQIDEAHQVHIAHARVIQDHPQVPVIGYTATPENQKLADLYRTLILGPTTAELTKKGFLVPVRAYAPHEQVMRRRLSELKMTGGDFNLKQLDASMNTSVITGNIIDTYKAKGESRQALCFAVNREHAQVLADDFTASDIPAVMMDYKTKPKDRERIFKQFNDGEIRIITSVLVLGVGTDLPLASCAILARPTHSLALSVQMLGRVLRTHDGKADALLLDHSGNLCRHGLPGDYDPQGIPEKGQRRKKTTVRDACPECGILLQVKHSCHECGWIRPIKTPRLKEVYSQSGELVSLIPESEAEKAHRWKSELRTHGHNKNYKSNWWVINYKKQDFKCGVDEGPKPIFLGSNWKLSDDIAAFIKKDRKKWRNKK